MQRDTIPVAREGVPFFGFPALAAVVFALLGWKIAAVIALVITAFVLYFFRDPARVVPQGEGLVVAPADGRVIEVTEDATGALQEGPTLRISIFMNVFNCHVNRSPVAGEVRRIVYYPGRFHSADKSKALMYNEHNRLLLATEAGRLVTVVQVAGLIARRIVCWAEPGDRLELGQRFGMIRFGSRLDLYLPADAQVEVEPRQRVRAGETVVARLGAAPAAGAIQGGGREEAP